MGYTHGSDVQVWSHPVAHIIDPQVVLLSPGLDVKASGSQLGILYTELPAKSYVYLLYFQLGIPNNNCFELK